MEEFSVDVLPGEVLRWVREDANQKHPHLWVRASREYRVDSEGAPQTSGEDDVSLVGATGTLEITPQRGRGGWTLQLRAEGTAELRPASEGDGLDPDAELNLDTFESEFLNPERGEVDVTVQFEDAAARRRFEDWLERKLRS